MTARKLDLGSRQGLVRDTEGYDRLLTCMSEDMQLDFAASGELVTVARRSDFVWQCRGLDVDVKGYTGALGDVGKQHKSRVEVTSLRRAGLAAGFAITRRESRWPRVLFGLAAS